ncbi:hypothetical protein [Vreelandella sulfidaeris]|uniref:hypothetical protein n=1 Tax=Vreelandella sulfidaeris TaxID=115553 RepID=UPI0035EBF2CE
MPLKRVKVLIAATLMVGSLLLKRGFTMVNRLFEQIETGDAEIFCFVPASSRLSRLE